MTSVADQVKHAKAVLAEAQTKRARLEGQQQELLSRLKKDFGLDGLSDADKYLAELEAELADKSRQRDEALQEMNDLVDEVKQSMSKA